MSIFATIGVLMALGVFFFILRVIAKMISCAFMGLAYALIAILFIGFAIKGFFF